MSNVTTANTPAPAWNIPYFWSLAMPEMLVVNTENSLADGDGFAFENIDQNQGVVLRVLGGTEADQYAYWTSLKNNPSAHVKVCGLSGCFPAVTGGGSLVRWTQNGTHYLFGGVGGSTELAVQPQSNSTPSNCPLSRHGLFHRMRRSLADFQLPCLLRDLTDVSRRSGQITEPRCILYSNPHSRAAHARHGVPGMKGKMEEQW